MSSYLDPSLFVMLTLRDNWSLTGDLTGSKFTGSNWNGLAVGFGTKWVDKMVSMPQVSVTPKEASVRQLNVGSGNNVTFRMMPIIDVDCWVRPPTSPGESYGKAKNMRHQMKEEVMRIIKVSGSNIQGLSYITVNDVNEFDELDERPPYFRTHVELLGWQFR